MTVMTKPEGQPRRISPDGWAMGVLVVLWALFFWRLLTPIEGDQASLKQGDFSGQFVAFGAYQYQRLAAWQVPLWDPYNNGGLPFLADTQSAVFYPPRLLTILLSRWGGGWTYHALELEMAFHVLAYSLMMYVFVRRMLNGQAGRVLGGFVAAVIAAYGGYITGYPPLQLALLEAGVWLPLVGLGVLEASRMDNPRYEWLVLAGFALGLSWMAGHPQTSWFLTYLMMAYWLHRSWRRAYGRRVMVSGVALIGALAGGMAAVQLLPGVEYLSRTTRTGFSFEAKANGFPARDVIQMAFPALMSLYSPLYVGVGGLLLAILALGRRIADAAFWGVVVALALALSLGANSAVFAALYNILPGMRFFRGQERAAYLVANGLALLAGIGMARLIEWKPGKWANWTLFLQRGLVGVNVAAAIGVLFTFSQWLNAPDQLGKALNSVVFSAVMVLALGMTIWQMLQPQPKRGLPLIVAGLIVFELFSVNMDSRATYDPVPPQQQLPSIQSNLLPLVLADHELPFRVDGYRGVYDNYGSLYGVADIRGISPLFLSGTQQIIQPDLINPLAWELFAVRYVFSDWQAFPVPSEIVADGTDRYGTVSLHKLTDPRPFALMVYQLATVGSDAEALALMKQAGFDVRRTIVLQGQQNPLPEGTGEGVARVMAFAPENYTIEVNTPRIGWLSIANPDYPGWAATIDGEPAPITRAYGALQAVLVPAGDHIVQLDFVPLSYRVGVLISGAAWLGLAAWLIWRLARLKRV